MWERIYFKGRIFSIFFSECVSKFHFFGRLNFIEENLFHHQMSSREWQMSREEGQHIQPYHFR